MSTVDVASPPTWDLNSVLRQPPASVRRSLKGTQLVPTPQMKLAVAYARHAVERGEIIGVDGKPGSGKSLLLAVLAASSPVRTYSVSFASNRRGKQMWAELAEKVVGPGVRGTEQSLMTQVRNALATEPSLLIIDEATNLSPQVLLALRWLDEMEEPCGIVLAGAGLEKFARGNGALATRIVRRVTVPELGDADLLPYLRQLHPLLAAAPESLLGELDDCHAKGNRRLWLGLLTALLDMNVTVVTPAVAKSAINACGGRASW